MLRITHKPFGPEKLGSLIEKPIFGKILDWTNKGQLSPQKKLRYSMEQGAYFLSGF
jgi:hypothetical protein